MNAAASTPPEQGKVAPTADIRYVPPEILDQILLKLPVKALLRFSTVSKSWNSMIFESRFVQEHKSLAALNGREKMVTIPSALDSLTAAASVCRIPLTSSERRPIVTEDSTDLTCVIEGTQYLRAFCDELWLVEVDESLYLLNQSMRSYRKLPKSPLRSQKFRSIGFAYGLAYDSAADDYKVLKIVRRYFYSRSRKTELYSLKSDSWKTISALPVDSVIEQKKFEVVNGAFHWIRACRYTIVSFNLSTEQYGEIALPVEALNSGDRQLEVVVWRGKLCVSGNNSRCRYVYDANLCFAFEEWSIVFELWVMEEYGEEKSWSKVLQVECSPRSIPCIPFNQIPPCRLRPLCFYDNGDILFNVLRYKYSAGLFIYTKERGTLDMIVAHDGRQIYGGFLYVETLISPWDALPRTDASEEGIRENAKKEGFRKRSRQ